ncbi:LytR/AlgR family response regulator transcription factor [Amphibiibacter pelophylacis]|uniref:LytTR family DNA-binding domain-containing protein n=1 Tax=Amphibiibacter pelophylacis TaxID=1799477 RepID=A0ACC6P313_9BURK
MSAAPASTAPAAAAPVALLVDDEPLARARLAHLLSEAQPGLRLIEAASAHEAQSLLGEPGLALIFLDIHMPGLDGMSWLAQMTPMSPELRPAVVLVSADPAQALRAFELDALDYLTKPVRRERLAQCLDKWRRQIAGAAVPRPADGAGDLQVLLQDSQRVLRLPLAEVLYWRADSKLLELQTTTARHLLDGSLQAWQDHLGDRVLRVHRNMLVPVHALRQLKASSQGWILQIQAGTAPACWVPVSRRQLAAVKAALGAS